MADDLSTPLGQDKKHKRSKLPKLLPRAVAGALGLCLVVFVVWAAVVDDPLGGEPIVVVSTDARAPPAKKPNEAAPSSAKGNADSEPKTEPKSATAAADTKQATAEPPKGPPARCRTRSLRQPRRPARHHRAARSGG